VNAVTSSLHVLMTVYNVSAYVVVILAIFCIAH